MSNTPQGGPTDANAADRALMVIQGAIWAYFCQEHCKAGAVKEYLQGANEETEEC